MTNDQEPGTVAEAPGEIHFTSFQGEFEMFKKCKKGSLPSGLLFVGLLALAIPQMANAAVIFFEDFSDNSAG
jgi:hypothetical protein